MAGERVGEAYIAINHYFDRAGDMCGIGDMRMMASRGNEAHMRLMKAKKLFLEWAGRAGTLDRALAFALMAVTAAVYLSTVCRGLYPGTSALETAQAMGLAPITCHAAALAAARIVSALPVRDAPIAAQHLQCDVRRSGRCPFLSCDQTIQYGTDPAITGRLCRA